MPSRWHIPILLAIIAATSAGAVFSPGFSDTDAAVHAMDGALMMDLLAAAPPLKEWREFATDYYARHPALGIVSYPPLFSMILALFYSIFGISLEISRIVVLGFSVGCVVLVHDIVKRVATRSAAFAAALFLAGNGEFVTWSRETMLEVPALFFLLAAAKYWIIHAETGGIRSLAASFGFVAAAVYTKQPAGFLAAALIAAELSFLKATRRVFLETAGSAILFAIILAPLGWITFHHGHYGTVQLDPANYGLSYTSIGYWTEWAGKLGDVVNPIVMVFALFGLRHLRVPGYRHLAILSLAWILVWYAAFSALPFKNPRFALLVVPPFCILAGLAVDGAGAALARRTAFVAGILLVGMTILRSPIPFVAGHEEAARYVAGVNSGPPVLFDGYHNANFIFHMRTIAPSQVVLRGCKMITATASGALKHYPVIENDSGVIEMLDRYGVRYVVVEESPHHELPHTKWLRSLLAAGRFRLEAAVPISTNLPVYDSGRILIYRYIDAKDGPATRTLEIFVPSAGMRIRADVL